MKEFDPKQRGEWWELGARLTNPTLPGKPPIDVTGKAVTLVVRTGKLATSPAATVDGAAGWVVDGPTGDVAVGGRITTPGSYYGTITVGDAADGPGWPQVEQFALQITDCP